MTKEKDEQLTLLPEMQKRVRDLCAAMVAISVERIECEFNGGGDEGSIADVGFFKAENVAIKEPAEAEKFHDLAYALLDAWGWDWINNEGGSGTLTIYCETKRVRIDGGVYEAVRHDYPAECKL